MILIADSGSTKTNWALIDKGQVLKVFKTEGINPFFRSTESIYDEIKKDLIPQIEGKISEVHFYGAGIINTEKGAGLKIIFHQLFPDALIETQSDLLAAARATCGNQPGIACILGTGSNSCLFDGQKILEQVSPLGFILGDEGSGAVMGRKLLGDYLKKVMPDDLRKKFNSEYDIEWSEILEKVYKKERPNLFLSGFTKFIYKNIQAEYCQIFVRKEFEAFVDRNLLNYSGCKHHPINFVGSIGFYFQDILKEVLKNRSLNCALILKDPMEGLISFHSKK
jgi:glucosamine kinase